ncbi:MAG: hypothetical protein ABI606_01710 [Rhodoferax sp.]
MREVEMPTEATREALREAFLAVVNEGHAKAVRTLERAWPAAARWPSGEAYLRSQGWRSDEEISQADEESYDYDGPELMELLLQRLRHVTGRLYRDTQVRAFIAQGLSSHWSRTHVVVNRHDFRDEDPCGFGPDRVVSIEEGLKLMLEPAHSHPTCGCTVDPHPVIRQSGM